MKVLKIIKAIIRELIIIVCIGLLLWFNVSYLLSIFAIFCLSIIVLMIDCEINNSVFNNENENIDSNKTFIRIVLCECTYTILYIIIYGGIQI